MIRLADFDIFGDPAEKAALLAKVADFNLTHRDLPEHATVHGLFSARAARTPDAAAVIAENGTLTYGELDRASNRLARALLDFGVTRETMVGVMLDRSPAMIVAMLAALKAGGAYLPLNHELPVARTAYILRNSSAAVLISERGRADNCLELRSHSPDINIIYLNDDQVSYECLDKITHRTSHIDYPDSPLPERADPNALAYAIYTSGTTGRPKGVMAEHRAIVRLVINTNYIGLGEGDRILQTGSLAFDASTFEIWGALLNGGSLCLAANESLLDAIQFQALTAKRGATTVFLTTGLFNTLASVDGNPFAGLRTVLSGGEKVSAHCFNKVRESNPGLRLKHVYGPTEGTTFSTCHEVTQHFDLDIPIGKPISNTETYILDSNLDLVGIGTQGELCIGGLGLARGYLGDPALTAWKFVPHPYRPGERLYRTGDLARWLDDGAIEFVGRKDEQLKIRGYRVEPAEIEQKLLEFAGIRQAAVVGRKSKDGIVDLVAFLVADGAADVKALRSHLRTSLPEYMIPTDCVALEALPLTPSGKVDRRKLLQSAPAPSPVSQPEAEPSNATERCLLTIWEDILNRRPIGLDDNFFEIGGYSLLVTKLMSVIHKKTGVALPFTAIFTAGTVRALACMVLDAARFGIEGIDSPMVLLNGPAGPRKIFAFPPATADALGYGQLAQALSPHHAFYAFNFIEAESRIADYADLIAGSEPEAPPILFGYSGGGNLAFHVAKELENRGRRVCAIVMLDSVRFERRFAFPPDEAPRVATQFLESEGARKYLTSPVLRDKAFRNIERYYAHLSSTDDRHVIDADIHLLMSDEASEPHRDEEGNVVCDKLGWERATRGRFNTYPGYGDHNTMLYSPFFESNVAKLREIFENSLDDTLGETQPARAS
jgi:amino acid adenylation domain-containing protein